MCPVFPSQLPLPLLTLRLSSSSFLDTILVDPTQFDETGNPIPLFTLETRDNHTTLYLVNGGLTRLASIQWPTSSTSMATSTSFNPYASTPNLGKGGKTKTTPMIYFGDDTSGTPANALLKKSLLGGSVPFSSFHLSFFAFFLPFFCRSLPFSCRSLPFSIFLLSSLWTRGSQLIRP